MGRPKRNIIQDGVVENTAPSVEEKEVKPIKTVDINSLEDTDEITVVSLDSNVCYFDKNTGNLYEWKNIGDEEIITVGVLKNMWRNYKSYFTQLCLRPMDERVIKKFGLDKIYAKYDFIMDGKNYTKDNIDEILQIIKSSNNGMKIAICNQIKNLISSGDIANVYVLRKLGNYLDVDFISLIDD